MVFIFLIGMISFTVMATTPLLDQKPKPTIELSVDQTVIVAVVFDVKSVSNEALIFTEFSSLKRQNQIVNINADVIDNRYCYEKPLFYCGSHSYTEKLTTHYKIDHRKRLQTIGLKYSLQYNC